MRLEGKVALISGGSQGMGATEAKLFAREGAKVIIGNVLDEQGIKVEAEIREGGGEATYVHLDVTQEVDWSRAVETAVGKYGRLDILVNNAGIGAKPIKIEDVSLEDWDRIMDVNGKGVFLGTRAAIPEMRKAGGGSIVNISSQAGIVGMHASAPQYQASKGAVRLFTKAAAVQYAKEGIRVNSVHPGPIVTPMSEWARSDPDRYKAVISGVPLGRYGQPEEVAFGVLYLASDESSYVTGTELIIDGGWTAQ